MSIAQYLKVVPQWLAGELPCYKRIVEKWVSDEFQVLHAEAAARRALLGNGVHRQGPLTLDGVLQRMEGRVMTKMEAFIETRKPKVLKPNVPLEQQWITETSKGQWENYTNKLKQVHGPDTDPLTHPFDSTISMLAGEGQRNGQLYIGGGSVDTSGLPSLSQLRASRTSSAPEIERRPRPGVGAYAAMQAEVENIKRIAEEATVKSRETQEKMAAMEAHISSQQSCLQAIMMRLPEDLWLPPLPPLPPLAQAPLLLDNQSAASNTAMDGGAGASPSSTPSTSKRAE
ncbi:unnamed protein product [Alopecurus aequalis]